MTWQRHMTIVLLSLALLATEAGTHPAIILAIGDGIAHVFAWTTGRFGQLLQPPAQCPWNPECI